MQFISCAITFVFLSACSTTENEKLISKPSYLLQDKSSREAAIQRAELAEKKQQKQQKSNSVEDIKPFVFKQKIVKKDTPIVERFSEDKKVKITTDELPFNEFIHYVMGEVLQVSYILGSGVKEDADSLTLNLIESVSHRKLYSLVEDLLIERGYVVHFNDGIYYINSEESATNKSGIVYGYGNQLKDIPVTSQEIWQSVPFSYAFNGALQLPLMRVAKVIVEPDGTQNTFVIKGKRNEVIKAVEFIRLFDRPNAGKKHISMVALEFADIDSTLKKLTALLNQEGISLGESGSTDKALSLVKLDNINSVVFFANTINVIERARFWLKKIDQPEEGEDIQYFIYAPQFSRAADLGESIQALIQGSTVGSSTSARNQNTRKSNSSSASNSEVKLVVDTRANSLIFQTTGDEYRKLLPLIKRLDVMPKQILLEVVIAEVQLTDEFKQGVSFSLTNKVGTAINGSYKLESNDKGLTYALTGLDGTFNLSLFQTNTHVNVLSRPSLLVRDGVGASFSVGRKVPTVGEIVTDPTNGSRTSVVYLNTGVDLKVTPTINAQGVVIMEVQQKNTDTVPGSSAVEGAVTVFERNISTEVVSESGQTVILGGLISENNTLSDTRVPFFSDLPILGKLFDSESDNSTKSELVIMVTPRVIESNNEWYKIYQKLSRELELLAIDDEQKLNVTD